MKSWTLIACAGLLALAGCTNSVAQGTTQAKEPVQEQEDASKKQDTSADTNTDVKDTTESKGTANTTTTDGSDAVSKNADRLQQGLKDAGFTVSDYEAELHEVSFDATNGNSFLGADVEYIPNARTSYDHQKNDNDVTVENEYTDGARSMCVVRDLEDNTYEILGVDEDSDVLYDIDDIKSEDIGTVKHIMVQVGFPADKDLLRIRFHDLTGSPVGRCVTKSPGWRDSRENAWPTGVFVRAVEGSPLPPTGNRDQLLSSYMGFVPAVPGITQKAPGPGHCGEIQSLCCV